MHDHTIRCRAVARIASLFLLPSMAIACATTDYLPAEEATVASREISPSPAPVTLTPTTTVFYSDQTVIKAELGKPFWPG